MLPTQEIDRVRILSTARQSAVIKYILPSMMNGNKGGWKSYEQTTNIMGLVPSEVNSDALIVF